MAPAINAPNVQRRNALWLLHLTVFIWGWTGILGKWIDQSA